MQIAASTYAYTHTYMYMVMCSMDGMFHFLNSHISVQLPKLATSLLHILQTTLDLPLTLTEIYIYIFIFYMQSLLFAAHKWGMNMSVRDVQLSPVHLKQVYAWGYFLILHSAMNNEQFIMSPVTDISIWTNDLLFCCLTNKNTVVQYSFIPIWLHSDNQ